MSNWMTAHLWMEPFEQEELARVLRSANGAPTPKGPSKEMWLTDPDKARELEREAQLHNAVPAPVTPSARPEPTQLSLFDVDAPNAPEDA